MNSKIPTGLPDTLILRQLLKKTDSLRVAAARKPPYAEWLKALRDQVAPELSYTNVTFPFFTPHDEFNHIHPLFFLAERLLGREVIEGLNAAELFVLSCSLYAHDWGMAVSEKEKNCILGIEQVDPAGSFRLLSEEHLAFSKSLRDRGIANPPDQVGAVPADVWQTYIRETHAARSAQRVRHFFSSRDKHAGEAVALVCEGHNLDVERLRSFDTSSPIQAEVVNVRALGLFLRLIDLFDIAQDRTPYALWKFVSPEEQISKLEWEKHQAIGSVVVEPFLETSRVIKVSGATDDHRVYAALEDLRDYCKDQLCLSNGLLNELTPSYQPRLVEIDWKIKANGFEPITVRFDFDRQSMIKLLSDEIYQGDRYVFLRELLQNSVDAIRLRRELHKTKGTGVVFRGAIRVEVDHRSDGQTVVSWSENGTGMSRFIIKNYLTVAGKSFYRSDDFKKLGVSMDPISRFGVGILSCFMTAERVDVLTRQDGELEMHPESLRIEITNPARHLRIERCPAACRPEPGTTVTVYLRKPRDAEQPGIAPPRLDVTSYLKEIAGFVEFPIYVEEDSKRTVILHPDQFAKFKASDGWQPTSLDLSFCWKDYFLPQDVKTAREVFTEEKVKLSPSAKNSLYEGAVTSPVLRDELELKQHIGGSGEFTSHYAIKGEDVVGEVRVHTRWTPQPIVSKHGRSAACDNMCRVYCDGILVPGVSVPNWVSRGWRTASTFRIVLNIRRSAGIRLDLARREIADDTTSWNDFVKMRCIDRFREKAKQIVAQKSPLDAYYSLARLLGYGAGFNINLPELIQDLAIPLVVVDEGGMISMLPSSERPERETFVVPRSLAESLGTQVMKGWSSSAWLNPNPKIDEWAGAMSVFGDGMTYGNGSDSFESLNMAEWLQEGWLGAASDLQKVRFLFPGKKKSFPLMQEIWEKRAGGGKKLGSGKGAKKRIGLASTANAAMQALRFHYGAPRFVEFASPFEAFFTAGWRYLNVLHPIAAALAECVRAVSDSESAGALEDHSSGKLKDLLRSMFGEGPFLMRDYLYGGELEARLETVQKLFELAEELEIFAVGHEISWSGVTTNIPPTSKSGRFGEPIRELSVVGI